jgi:hypothetical protein
MIKLIDILEDINEAKQVGDIYHFTGVLDKNGNRYLMKILNSGYLKPNEDNQISTTRNKKVDVYSFIGHTPDYMARLTLDGNKISNNYKIKPFYFANQGDPAYLAKDEFEEQIITNGKNFPIYPYLKKVDLFVKDKEEEEVNKVIDFLDEKNINYEIHIGEYRP